MNDAIVTSPPRRITRKSASASGGWAVALSLAALAVALGALFVALHRGTGRAGPNGWLHGTLAEKLDELAAQQRGFDPAMWEIGYRFHEPAWAGRHEDRTYATHQLDKIVLTMEQAMVRRPARADSSRLFFVEGVEPLRTALALNPRDYFPPRLAQLRAACINGHAREAAPIVNLHGWMTAPAAF